MTLSGWIADSSFLSLSVATTLFLVAMNGLFSAIGVFVERSSLGRNFRIWSMEVPEGQVRREIGSSLRFNVLAGVCMAGMVSTGVVHIAADASAWITFGACWIAFEIYYWALHRAMHTRALFRFHKFHHDSKVTTPFTGLSMSTVEGLGWILGFSLAPILLSIFGSVSAVGWMLYLFYNYSGNIVGHVNAEILPNFLRDRKNSWAMHPVVYHSLHHARFVNHYGFGSTFMDRLMQTEWADWPKLHERVVSGKPLSSFAQKG